MRLENLNIGDIGFRYQAGPRFNFPVNRITAMLALWRERARQRLELAQFNDQLRRDLGITDADVWRETHKRPWQA